MTLQFMHKTRPKSWRLITLPILHAALLTTAKLGLQGSWPEWFQRLWIGLITLWFLWPIILLLQSKQARIAGLAGLTIAGIILYPCMEWYSRDAFVAFEIQAPPFVKFSPFSISRYLLAYRRGRSDALRDLQSGQLALEVYGGPGDLVGAYYHLEKNYNLKVRAVAGCVVDEAVVGHANGYNRVSAAEVGRLFGVEILDRQTGLPKMLD